MNLTKRYENNRTNSLFKNKRTYNTILYPTIEKSYTDIYVIPNETDRLDLLAYKYYGDVRYWWIIAQANNLGKGSLYTTPGERLRIPKNLDVILSNFNDLNAAR